MLVIYHFDTVLHPEEPSLTCLKFYRQVCPQMHVMSKCSLDHKNFIQLVIWKICCMYKQIIFGTGQISVHQALWLAVLNIHNSKNFFIL